MSKKQELIDYFQDIEEELILFDDLDDALVGYAERIGMQTVPVYDKDRCIEILIQELGDEQSALDWFYFNTIGSYLGEGTPIFITKLED